MKLIIERAALLKSLAHVQSVVERRNTIPILSNVLMDASSGTLSLTATDMDLTIVEDVSADVTGEGATTASAHTLYDIVRKLPDGAQIELALSGDNGQMTLTAGRSTFTLTTLPREDFPAANQVDLPQSFKVPATELRNLIDRTRFAISTEETRYYLNGIYLHAAESGGVPVLRAVATDGHRLARFEMPLPDGAKGMPGVIVPRKTVAEVRKLLDEADDSVDLGISDTRTRFSFNSVKLALSDGMLVLSATSAENGSAVEEIEVGFSGEGLEIGFNSRYLLDIAEQIEGNEALFQFSDAASPTIVRDAGDESALYVLMPMRV